MCLRRFERVGVNWGQDAEVRTSDRQRVLGPQWPTVEQPQPRWDRSAAMVRITWVCPRLQLSSHTQPTSTLLRIKCERYIFIKKYVLLFIEVVIIVDYVFAYICICMWLYNITTISEMARPQAIGLLSRVFANGLGNWGSIPGCVIPKTQKIVLDVALLNTQHYKVRFKGSGAIQEME